MYTMCWQLNAAPSVHVCRSLCLKVATGRSLVGCSTPADASTGQPCCVQHTRKCKFMHFLAQHCVLSTYVVVHVCVGVFRKLLLCVCARVCVRVCVRECVCMCVCV